MARSESDTVEMHNDTLDDVTQVGPFIDMYQDVQATMLSAEFRQGFVESMIGEAASGDLSYDDPFGLTQIYTNKEGEESLEGQAVRRIAAPEALMRVNFFVSDLAKWLFSTTQDINPESIKRTVTAMLQDTRLPPELSRENPGVDQFSEKKKRKACVRFIESVNLEKVFLPCEIAGVVASDAYQVYSTLMKEFEEGKIPEVFGHDRTLMVTQFINKLCGYVMFEAIRVAVKVEEFVIPKGVYTPAMKPDEVVEVATYLVQGSERIMMQKEGRKGLSAETVHLVLQSLHENLTRFNSYVEYLIPNLKVAESGQTEQEAHVLLCSYVWALWHVSGTSVLEAEEHLSRAQIELTQERKEDLMILSLMNLSFEDFKKPWSAVFEKIKQNRQWVERYANPAQVRKDLLKRLKSLKEAQDQIEQNRTLKLLIDQQQALKIEQRRLKKMAEDFAAIERQGGIEAEVRKIRSKTTHLNARDLELFDLFASVGELHPQCKMKVRSDMSESDLSQVLKVLSEEPFESVLKKRLMSVESQLQSAIEEINTKMPEGVLSYQTLETDIKNIDREIRMAEFVYSMSLGKTFDADQADVHLKTNQNAFVARMKDMHAERLAGSRRKKKEEAVKEAPAETGKEER